MAWTILCGIDRSGKSTVAKHYESKGYKYVHFSAPEKKYYQPGYTGPSYLDDLVEMLVGLSGQDVVFDRSWYGEACIWPFVYGRTPLLGEDDLEILRDIENQNDTTRILMEDPAVEAHWQRCFDNKEPLSRSQFNSARQLYNAMAIKYDFSTSSRDEFLSKEEDTMPEKQEIQSPKVEVTNVVKMETSHKLTPEQLKLQQANAINDVLSSRVVKKKGTDYDAIESRIREFLNTELARLLGTAQSTATTGLPFSSEEVTLLKALANRVKDKRA